MYVFNPFWSRKNKPIIETFFVIWKIFWFWLKFLYLGSHSPIKKEYAFVDFFKEGSYHVDRFTKIIKFIYIYCLRNEIDFHGLVSYISMNIDVDGDRFDSSSYKELY